MIPNDISASAELTTSPTLRTRTGSGEIVCGFARDRCVGVTARPTGGGDLGFTLGNRITKAIASRDGVGGCRGRRSNTFSSKGIAALVAISHGRQRIPGRKMGKLLSHHHLDHRRRQAHRPTHFGPRTSSTKGNFVFRLSHTHTQQPPAAHPSKSNSTRIAEFATCG